MSARLCEDCGKPVFFNHHQWSNQGNRTTHGGSVRACLDAAAALDDMPRAHDDLVQTLVEISELTGRFISESDEEEWNNVDLLQRVVLRAMDMAMKGIGKVARAPKAEEPANAA